MLKIYNSLTNKKEKFCSIEKKKINIYVCGPTVYDHLHIGNLRPLIFFNFVKRYFLLSGWKVNLVVNITDIDDKIIKKSIDNQVSETQISQKYIDSFFNLLSQLEIETIDKYPLVTDYIQEIILYINQLIKKGYTYTTSEGIYFKSCLIKDYGNLSNQNLKKLKKNVKNKIDLQKENLEDFVLWKKTKNGVKYESPWFSGRPGWHTECVAMIQDIFRNNTIDIHGGGSDLKFPHHENENAQFWAIHQKPIANFFIHIGRVDYKQNKMSKSLGNVVLAKDLLQKFESNVVKLFFLSYHYSQPIDYNEKLIQDCKIKYYKIVHVLNKNNFRFVLYKIENEKKDSFYSKKFDSLISNDFDTPNIFTLIEELLKTINKTLILNELSELQNTLLYILENLSIFIIFKDITEEQKKTYKSWKKARQNKDFEKSDFLRNILQKEKLI